MSSFTMGLMAENTKKHFSEKDLVEEICRVLISWPLYRSLSYTCVANPFSVPAMLQMYCENQRCESVTIWETTVRGNISASDFRGWKQRSYKCRNCQESTITYYYYWRDPETASNSAGLFFKYGQFPEMRADVPPELGRRLDPENRKLYDKSMKSRNEDMGLGAVAYLRRVVENKINDLLDMIAEEAKNYHFQEEELKKLVEVKKSYRFSDKIEYASLILPPSLRPGGHNPINQLHDLSSEGLHYLPDHECLEIHDAARPVFEYLFREIDLRKRSAEKYAEQLTKLATSRKPKSPAPTKLDPSQSSESK